MPEMDEISCSSITKKSKVLPKKHEFGSDPLSNNDDTQSFCQSKISMKSNTKNKKDNSNSDHKKLKQITNNTKQDGNKIKLEQLSSEEKLKSEVKQLENTIRSLERKLLRYVNHNQLLRKGILIAKNIVKREIGGNADSFEELLKKEEVGWLGREEIFLSLKKKLYNLKSAFQQKGGLAAMNSKRYSSIGPSDLPADLKELECENTFRNLSREMKFWLQERDRMKEKLDSLLNRNSKLTQQVSSIRFDLNKTPKDLSVITISQMFDMEREVKIHLENKSNLKKSLDAEKLKAKKNESTIEKLRTEIILHRTALMTTAQDLASLKSQDIEFQCLANEVKIGVEKRVLNSQLFREDLSKIAEYYRRLWEELDYFKQSVEKSEQRDSIEFAERQNLKPIHNSKSYGTFTKIQNASDFEICSQPVFVTGRVATPDLTSSTVNGQTGEEDKTLNLSETQTKQRSSNELQIKNLESEFFDICSSFEAAKRKSTEKSRHIQNVLYRLKMEIGQLLHENNIFWKESANIKILTNRLRKLQKVEEDITYKNNKENNLNYVEDSKLLLQLLRNENLLLENLIQTVFITISEDFEKYLQLCEKKYLSLLI